VEKMMDESKLEEIIEKAIKDNITIIDPNLYDAVYTMAMDVIEAYEEFMAPYR
jgi:hypothetical protein